MSFSAKVIKSRAYLIRLVTGDNYDRQAWWIIKVLPHKFESFKRSIQMPNLNLDEFGEVLHKGWGETAPVEILREIEAAYA